MSILASASAERSAVSFRKNPETKNPVEGQLLYPIATAAKILGISPRLLWQFIAEGKIKTRRIHTRRLVHIKELEKFASRDHESGRP